MKRITGLVLFFVCVILFAAFPAAGAEKAILLDECKYASVESARAQWKPVEKDGAPVGVGTVGGKAALKLPYNFSGNDHWNISWQREGSWNLSDCRRIVMDVTTDRSRATFMQLMLRSGDGWYWYSWLYVPPGTNTITMPREAFGTFLGKGRPGGWDKITAVRIGVVREAAGDRAILISGLRAAVHNPKAVVAVYRNTAAVKSRSSVRRAVSNVTYTLDRLGIAYNLLDDKSVASGGLAGKKVAILPYNPVLPKESAAAIKKFVAAGGKLIVFSRLPEPLGELLGVRIDGNLDGKAGRLDAIRLSDSMNKARQPVGSARRIILAKGAEVGGCWVRKDGSISDAPAVTRNKNGCFVGCALTAQYYFGKDRLMCEMLGLLWPEADKVVYHHRRKQLGKTAGFGGVKELEAAIEANRPQEQRAEDLEGLLLKARGLTRYGYVNMVRDDAAGAAYVIKQAHQAYLCAYAVSVPSKPGEFRAVWCHDPRGVRGMTWDQAMKGLSDAGFNAIIPNMSWGDAAAHKSKLLPLANKTHGPLPDKAEGRDLLAECIAAGKKHGIAVHVWKCNMRCWHKSSRFYKDLLAAGRFQTDWEGKPINYALCPSDPANRKLEIDSMVEIARDYDVAGIHFDYIRYPGEIVCYCDRCRKRFEAEYKVKVKNWPADVRTGPLKGKYLQFRRDQITAIVAGVSRKARKARPNILISAAVFWHWPSARIRIGQDWKLWVEKGYLDFVCPMQYTTNASDFEGQTQATSKWVGGRIPLMPGIGSVLGMRLDQTLHQVLITRKHKTAGFVLFNYDPVLGENYLRLLRFGATAKKTAWTPKRKIKANVE